MIHAHHQPLIIACITSVTSEGLIWMVIHHNTSSRGAVVVVSIKRKTGAKDRSTTTILLLVARLLLVPAIHDLRAINASVCSCLSDNKGARCS